MKKEFIVNRQGRDFVLYAGLLDQATTEGLKRIHTHLVQAPCKDNEYLAIVHAEVETEKGIFNGIGDASPQNVGRMIAPHITRMAETRAKARALRDAINVGMTTLEELGDLDDEPANPSAQATAPKPAPTPSPNKPAPRQPTRPVTPEPAGFDDVPLDNKPATEAQLRQLTEGYAKLAQHGGWKEEIPDRLTFDAAARLIQSMYQEASTRGLIKSGAARG